MRYNEVIELGNRLRESDIKTISTEILYQLLGKASNVMTPKILKRYLKILRDAGYVAFNSKGVWEVVRGGGDVMTWKYNRDKPIETVQELNQCIEVVKAAKPTINDGRKRSQMVRDEARYERQKHQVVEMLEETLREEKATSNKEKGVNVIWVDPYEYHVICGDCYQEEMIGRTNNKGKISLEEILALNPTKCEYCGELLVEKKEEEHERHII